MTHSNGILPFGTRVVCAYRQPSDLQPWIHPVHVGTVEAPGTDPADWNGHNSEAHYCDITGSQRVRYAFGVMHDSQLEPLTDEVRASLEARGMTIEQH